MTTHAPLKPQKAVRGASSLDLDSMVGSEFEEAGAPHAGPCWRPDCLLEVHRFQATSWSADKSDLWRLHVSYARQWAVSGLLCVVLRARCPGDLPLTTWYTSGHAVASHAQQLHGALLRRMHLPTLCVRHKAQEACFEGGSEAAPPAVGAPGGCGALGLRRGGRVGARARRRRGRVAATPARGRRRQRRRRRRRRRPRARPRRQPRARRRGGQECVRAAAAAGPAAGRAGRARRPRPQPRPRRRVRSRPRRPGGRGRRACAHYQHYSGFRVCAVRGDASGWRRARGRTELARAQPLCWCASASVRMSVNQQVASLASAGIQGRGRACLVYTWCDWLVGMPSSHCLSNATTAGTACCVSMRCACLMKLCVASPS